LAASACLRRNHAGIRAHSLCLCGRGFSPERGLSGLKPLPQQHPTMLA
jgi:hypothetical protein